MRTKLQINKKRLALSIALAVAIVLFFVWLFQSATFKNFKLGFFGEPEEAGSSIKIAVYEPFSGADSRAASYEIRGINLANSLYPELDGTPIELITADNRSDLAASAEAAKEVVLRSPVAVLGSYGSAYSLAAAATFEEAEIPAISITNVNPIVTIGNPYYVSISYSETYEAVALAKYVVEGLGITSVASLSPVGDQVAENLIKSFDEKVMQLSDDIHSVKSNREYPVATEEFSEYLMDIKREGAKAVFLPVSTAEAFTIISQARELGIDAVFLGPSSWDDISFARMLIASGCDRDVAFPTAFDPATSITPMTDVFLEAYHEKYGEDATPKSEEVLGFDAYILLLDVLSKAGKDADGAHMLDTMLHNRGFQGASGSISFDATGSAIKSVVIKGISEGEINSIYTVEPNWVNINETEDQ